MTRSSFLSLFQKSRSIPFFLFFLSFLILFPSTSGQECQITSTFFYGNAFPIDVTSVFPKKDVNGKFYMLISGSYLLAFNTSLIYNQPYSFDTGQEIIYDGNYDQSTGLFFVRTTKTDFGFYDNSGILVLTTFLDVVASGNYDNYEQETSYLCILRSDSALIQNIYDTTDKITINAAGGETFYDCSVHKDDSEAIFVTSYGPSAIKVSLYSLGTGLELQNTIVTHSVTKSPPDVEHGEWSTTDIYVVIFSTTDNPFSVDISNFFSVKYLMKKTHKVTQHSNFKQLHKVLLGYVFGWNTYTEKYEIYTSKMIYISIFGATTPKSWTNGGMVAAQSDGSGIAVYKEADGFFEAWDFAQNYWNFDQDSDYRSNKGAGFYQRGTNSVSVLTHGTDFKYFDNWNVNPTFQTECRYLTSYNFQLTEDVFFYSDEVDSGPVMTTSDSTVIQLFKKANLCVVLNFTSASSLPNYLLEDTPRYFVTKNELVYNVHAHIKVISHGFDQRKIDFLTKQMWAAMMQTFGVRIILINYAFLGTFHNLGSLDVLDPTDFKWVPRKGDICAIYTDSLYCYIISDMTTLPSLSSSSLVLANNNGTVLTRMEMMKDSGLVVAWASDSNYFFLFDSYSTVVVKVVPQPSGAPDAFSIIDAQISKSKTNIFVLTTFGMIIFDPVPCGVSMSVSSCNKMCLTCLSTNKESCTSCRPGVKFDSTTKTCLRDCLDGNKMVRHHHSCEASCPTGSTYTRFTSICGTYQLENCGISSPLVWDSGASSCRTSCLNSTHRFSFIDYKCGVDSNQEFGSTQNYKNNIYWGGPELCALSGTYALSLSCNSGTSCASFSLYDSGLSPYCRSDCKSTPTPTIYEYQDTASKKCYKKNKCPSTAMYQVELGTNKFCTSSCTNYKTNSFSLRLSTWGHCIDNSDYFECNFFGLFAESSSKFCQYSCSSYGKKKVVFDSYCELETAKGPNLYYDSLMGYLVGGPENCVFGENIYHDPSTYKCISIDECTALGKIVTLSTRKCEAITCAGSSAYGVCCDIISATGCSWDGVTPCDPSCSPFSCYGALSTQCCSNNCRTCITSDLEGCTSCARVRLSNGTCCDIGCSTCSGPGPTECLTCATDYFRISDNRCITCHSSCSTCFDDQATNCLTCFSGDFFHLSDDHCGSCLSSQGSYSVSNNCYNCHSACQTCSAGTSTDCLSCSPGVYLFPSDNHCSACVSSNGFYQSSGNCYKCDSTCLTCSGGTSNHCLSCSLRKYIDSVYHICITCHSSCSSCSGLTRNDCISCPIHLYFHSSDSHCGSCDTSNSFLELGNCYHCHSSCSSCNGASQSSCLSCRGSLLLHQSDNHCSACVSANGYYQSFGSCIQCDSSCLTCSSGTTSDCLSCSFGKYFDLVGHLCSSCHSSCSSCSGPLSNDCLSCSNFLFYHISDRHCGSCDSTNGYVSIGNCLPCHSSCSSCSGDTSNDCLSCPTQTFYHSSDSHCGICDTSNSYSKKKNCFPCHSSCSACNGGSPDACLSCKGSLLLHQSDHHCGSCSSSQNNYLFSGVCYPCDSNCDGCTGGSNLDCIKCQPTSFFHSYDGSCKSSCKKASNLLKMGDSNECVLECPSDYYLDSNDSTCYECKIKNCKACKNESKCAECISDYYIYQGLCSDGCPEGKHFFENGESMICSDCPLGCLECDAFDSNICLNCKNEKYIYEGACKSSCPSSTYIDNAAMECKKCTFLTCFLCNGMVRIEQSQLCVYCSNILGFFERDGKCFDICGDGKRFNETDFIGLSKYLSCDDGNLVNGDGCDSSCKIEEGFVCSGGSPYGKDTCYKEETSSSDISWEEISEGEDLNVFAAYGSYLSNNGFEAQVSFTEDLKSPEKALKYIEVIVSPLNDSMYNYTLDFVDNNTLGIHMNYNCSHRDSYLVVSFTENDKIKDIYGRYLETDYVYFSLPIIDHDMSDDIPSYEYLEASATTLKATFLASGGALVVVTVMSTAFGNSMTKPLIWSMAFMLQNMQYYILVSVDYPKNFQNFVKAFVIFDSEMVNNTFEYIRNLTNSEIDPNTDTRYQIPNSFSSQNETNSTRLLKIDEHCEYPSSYVNDDNLSPKGTLPTNGSTISCSKSRKLFFIMEEKPYFFDDYDIDVPLVENCYTFFLLIILQVLSYLLILLIYCLCRCRTKSKKKCRGYIQQGFLNFKDSFEFGTFLSNFRTEFMEMVVYSWINIKYGEFGTIYDGFNYLLALLLLILSIGGILLIIRFFRIKSFEEITKGKCSGLLNDFKPSFLSRYFVLFEIGRALIISMAFALMQEFPVIQSSILCVSNVIFCILLLAIRPYKLKMPATREFFINFFFMFASILVFALAIDEEYPFLKISQRSTIGYILIYIFMILLFCGFLLIIIDFISQIFMLIKGYLLRNKFNEKNERFPKKRNLNKVYPQEEKTLNLQKFSEVDNLIFDTESDNSRMATNNFTPRSDKEYSFVISSKSIPEREFEDSIAVETPGSKNIVVKIN